LFSKCIWWNKSDSIASIFSYVTSNVLHTSCGNLNPSVILLISFIISPAASCSLSVSFITFIAFSNVSLDGFLREELPVTAQYLNKILQVHYEHNGELLSKLNKLFNSLKVELEEHLVKEEVLLSLQKIDVKGAHFVQQYALLTLL